MFILFLWQPGGIIREKVKGIFLAVYETSRLYLMEHKSLTYQTSASYGKKFVYCQPFSPICYIWQICKTFTCLLWISVQVIHSIMSDSLWPHGLQHSRPPCLSSTPGDYSNSCPSSWWCHATIPSSGSPSPPAFNLSQLLGLFRSVSCSHQVAKVWECQLQHQPFQWIFRTDFL